MSCLVAFAHARSVREDETSGTRLHGAAEHD
jgi:hypothetical protein